MTQFSSEDFIKRNLVAGFYMSLGVLFILFLLLANSMETVKLIMIISGAFPVIYFFMFFYFHQFPKVKIKKLEKEINKEIIYAGRFLIVALDSGVTLYDAMKNMGKSYPAVGAYFTDIVYKINIGTSIEDAVSEAIETCPSDSLTKIFWQISNSLRTGSNVSKPLSTVVETILKEQQILVNEYGRKLNPLAMFYMLIAIIAPSLGVTMLTIVSIFVGLKLNLVVFFMIAAANGMMQLMFVMMVNSIRPPVEF